MTGGRNPGQTVIALTDRIDTGLPSCGQCGYLVKGLTGGNVGPPIWPILALAVFWLSLWALGFWRLMGSWSRAVAYNDGCSG